MALGTDTKKKRKKKDLLLVLFFSKYAISITCNSHHITIRIKINDLKSYSCKINTNSKFLTYNNDHVMNLK